jgi:hypothetical protein
MITRITDAPPPSPNPWADDPPNTRRCPACALPDPGEPRCRRCGKAVVVKTARRRPMTANMANLLVVLIGRAPMLLAIGFLYRPEGTPLLSPVMIWLGLQLPLLWLAAAALTMRWRWAWYLAFLICGVDLLAQVVLQLLTGGSIVLTIAAVVTDLMVMGFLLTIYDEVRVDMALLSLPEEANMPRTPLGAYNAGVEYSQAGLWFFTARMWQRAVAQGSHEGRYRRALGMAYLRLREYEAAANELEAARILMPGDDQTTQLIAALGELRAQR